jgi:hypothetical protein
MTLGLRNFAPFKINDLTGESTSHYELDRKGVFLGRTTALAFAQK